MISNANRSFLGSVTASGSEARFTIESELATASFQRGLREGLALAGMMRRMKGRLEAEASRRGQAVPRIRITG